MAGQDRDERAGLIAALEREPTRFDFQQALRIIDAVHSKSPPLGRARRPVQEPVRLTQEPWLAFPPANLTRVTSDGTKPTTIEVRFLGLFGPQGPLPLHLTALARNRMTQERDPTFKAFCDIFHHRILSLFYRAWAESQPCALADRRDARLERRLGHLAGVGPTELAGSDGWQRRAELNQLALLARKTRSASAIEAVIARLFGHKTRIESFAGGWLSLPREARMRLGALGRLGSDTILGKSVFERQHRFEIRIGPLGLADFERFLTGGRSMKRLREFLRLAVHDQLDWALRPVLARSEIVLLELNGKARLGRTSWLFARAPTKDSEDVCVQGAVPTTP